MKIEFLRDFKNCLQLLSDQKQAEFVDSLERDTTRMQIAKVATRNFSENVKYEELLKEKESKQNLNVTQTLLQEAEKNKN